MKNPFYRNPRPKWQNVAHGFANLIDGLVRVLSLGWIGSSCALELARHLAKREFSRARKQQGG
jgi:hypothetical protein